MIAGSHNLTGVVQVRVDANRRPDALGRHRRPDGAGRHGQAAAGPNCRSHRHALPGRGAAGRRGRLRLVVADRSRPCHRGGHRRADRHLSVRPVAGHAGGHAGLPPARWRAHGVLVRRLQALEACASVDTVVFDKTGTLTEDRMAVVATPIARGRRCRRGRWRWPRRWRATRCIRPRGPSPQRRRPGPVGRRGSRRGRRARRARPDRVRRTAPPAPSCASGRPRSAARRPQPAMPRGPQVHLADEQGWLASFDLDEALRPGRRAPRWRHCASLGLRLQLLSGDRGRGVQRLARRAGIDAARGDCSPEDKLDHVRHAQRAGPSRRHGGRRHERRTGAGARRRVDRDGRGRAAGAGAGPTSWFSAASCRRWPRCWAQARRTRDVVRQNLAWAALYNAVCVPLAVAGAMPPWLAGLGMAASSLLVVANSARLARIPALPSRRAARRFNRQPAAVASA